jgi:oligopeptide transport system substrate-binding protein
VGRANLLSHLLPCLALLAALTLTGCSKRPAGVDFIFINGAECQSLDPAVITGQHEGRIASTLFEGLAARTAEGEVEPGTASSWDVSPDGLTYTFHIRPEAKWSNGDPVTAQDYAGSWHRILEPATAAPYAYILDFIKNAEPYRNGKLTDFSQVGIKVLDDRTLQVTLNAPTPFFPELTSFTTYLPVHLPTVEKFGDRWIMPENIVVNGPYRLKAWKINNRIELEKNPRYWRAGTVAFNRVDALAVSKANTALNLYLTGQADLILDKGLVPATLIGELKKQPDFHTFSFLANYFYRFNVTRPPFNDVRVRKAFSAAINRQEIVERITRAGEAPATTFVPPGLPGYPSLEGVGFDPDQAKKWLAEAGYPDGKGFPRIALLYNKTDLNEQVATEIQDMWDRTLGVKVELRNQEWATYLTSLDELDYDVARSSWVGDYRDANTFLDCFITGGGNNRTGWSDPKYDALIKAAGLEPNPATRLTLLSQAEQILVQQQCPIAPIYFLTGIMLYDGDRLGGISGNLVDEHPIRAMFWKK